VFTTSNILIPSNRIYSYEKLITDLTAVSIKYNAEHVNVLVIVLVLK